MAGARSGRHYVNHRALSRPLTGKSHCLPQGPGASSLLFEASPETCDGLRDVRAVPAGLCGLQDSLADRLHDPASQRQRQQVTRAQDQPSPPQGLGAVSRG